MKLTIHCFVAILFSILIITQTNAQSAYSMHTLAEGETLSMLAKSYHSTVGDIMRMNGMNTQSQLHVGDKIKIPAGRTVVAAKPLPAKVSAQPVQVGTTAKTHVVVAGETLYHISKLYNIPVEKLQALNKLADGNVKVGETLLVSEGAPPQASEKIIPKQNAVTPKAMPVEAPQNNTITSTPAKTEAPSKTNATDIITPQKVDTIKSVAPVTTQTNVATEVNNNNNQPINTYATPVNAPKEGFFTSLYGKEVSGRQEQTKSGSSMTFKSASGWADKKYYILMNDAPTGSIVKIKNGRNELYAKVLWSLGAMKENEGLAFRISTATAAALGITDQTFDLKVSYYE